MGASPQVCRVVAASAAELATVVDRGHYLKWSRPILISSMSALMSMGNHSGMPFFFGFIVLFPSCLVCFWVCSPFTCKAWPFGYDGADFFPSGVLKGLHE